ncbi:FitA-like ribbon-helix-helix domain-containing protein [Streptomyces yangpuensis]|uniref:Antitoxin n=1 Tax=Streptomyces yangpuensis TaxID=1648182 RepID=A0ABY5PVM4_9ACTN|nr:antitoxin [Streptomyces yangpuensis]MBZ9596123.1 antitoxin [Streptomyces erythrochromogenes]UUY48075.1 antitoxin [Streptomyces yangpuensis]
MTAFTIREVPDDIARRIKVRAAEAGQSLQGYLLSLVTRDATQPTLAEMADRAERYATEDIDIQDVLDAIDAGRTGR